MITKNTSSILLFATLVIPLDSVKDWKELKFRNIRPNAVAFSQTGIEIKVHDSASPLIYSFNGIKTISEIRAEIEVDGQIIEPKGDVWKIFEEDSAFRFGVIVEGNRKLEGMTALFAPQWVKTFFSMAPKNSGLDKIYFYNVTQRADLLGKKRQHIKSDLIHEENVVVGKFEGASAKSGSFEMAKSNTSKIMMIKKFESPKRVAGIWISIDGDDAKAKYVTRIKKIEILLYAEKNQTLEKTNAL